MPPLSVRMTDRDPMDRDDRLAWLDDIARRYSGRLRSKFTKGMIEHKGDIGEHDIRYLIDAIEEEALDTLAYVAELRRRLNYNHKL